MYTLTDTHAHTAVPVDGPTASTVFVCIDKINLDRPALPPPLC